MQSDLAAVAGYAARSSHFHTQRFLALLSGDAQRAVRALWGSLETANIVGLLSSEAALQLLAQGAAEVTSARALVLFQLLAAAPGALAAQPAYSTQPYPGYCAALETLLRALPERRALVASWATLAAPIGPALGFALARLGELPGADLGSAALDTFARAAAARFTACPEGFRDAERAFGEGTWRRAVIAAAASPKVERVAMGVSHCAPFAPYASDEELLAIGRKMTVGESEVAALFCDRGPAMGALLQREAEAARLAAPDSYALLGGLAFTLTVYARELSHRSQPLPEPFVILLRSLLERRHWPSCVGPLLQALPAERRQVLLLEWARSLKLDGKSDHDLTALIELAWPALAWWAVAQLVAGTQSYVIENQLADFGPETVPALAAVAELATQPQSVQWATLSACATYPSATAAQLAAELTQKSPHAVIAAHAATVLAQQPVAALVAQVRQRWSAAPPAVQVHLGSALSARAFEPEVRGLATELWSGVGAAASPAAKATRRALAPATDAGWPLPAAVRAFVEAVRRLPDETLGPDEPLMTSDNLQTAEAAAAKYRAAPPEVARLALYHAVAGKRWLVAAALAELLAQEDEALWFFVFCGWDGTSWLLHRLIEAAGPRIAEPLLALWQTPILRERLPRAEGEPYLLKQLAELDLRAVLTLLADPQLKASAALRPPLRTVVVAALADPALRQQALAVLRPMLADSARRGLALEVASVSATPELLAALVELAADTLRKNERELIDRAVTLAQPLPRPSAAVVRELTLNRLAVAGSAPITRIERVGAVIAAGTASELTLLELDGQPRGRVSELAGPHSLWQVAPDGSYVAVLDEDGVALYQGNGRPMTPPHRAGAGKDDAPAERLYPNDGLCGVLPLSKQRLLVWAAGQNVDEPLTLYDLPSGQPVKSPKTKSFACDAVLLPGEDGFAVVTTAGAVELRASADGKRRKQLGKVPLPAESSPFLRVLDGGAALLVLSEKTGVLLRRQPDGQYARSAAALDLNGTVISSPESALFVAVSGPRVAVYTATGALHGVLEVPDLAAVDWRCAALSQSLLGLAAGKSLTVYDLQGLARYGTATAESPITALCGDQNGFLLGTTSGAILRCT